MDGSEPQLQRITYAKPILSGLRGITPLANTATLSVIVQTLAPGARQGLHAHGSYDGFYFVLAGRARFYGRDNEFFGEIGPGEAVFVPRNTPYAFEAAGGEVQLLAVDAIDRTVAETFTSYEAGSDVVNFELFTPDGTKLESQELRMKTQAE
jgi:mannose-6-phosphate isomerase-like protein (cupin superfamily)